MITKEATILERPKTALSCRLWVPASMLRALWKYVGDHAEGQRKFDDKGKHTLGDKGPATNHVNSYLLAAKSS